MIKCLQTGEICKKTLVDNNKNTLFLPDNKYELKKTIGAILAAHLMWAVEPVLAKVEMKLSGQVYIGKPKRPAEQNS